ncbi:MAG: MFS transporter [Verrucomicrobiae bacterium]|nr:MFS transporter [Verrucomicrobiae bacterium]
MKGASRGRIARRNAGDAVSPDEARSVLWVVGLASFLMPFGSSSVPVALPAIGHEFGLDTLTLNRVLTVFLMSVSAIFVPAGRYADIHGRRRVFAWGIAIFTVASMGAALATGLVTLLTARVVQGVGAACMATSSTAMIASVYPPGKMGEAQGYNVAAIYLGLSVGPFFGGLMTEHFGWRSLFVSHVVIGGALLYSTARRLRGEWRDAAGEKFDGAGSALYAGVILLLTEGLLDATGPRGWTLLGAGIVGAGVFLRRELRGGNPVFPLDLFRGNVTFTFSNLAALINYAATFAQGFLMSLYLQEVRGMGPALAGTILVAQPILQTVFSPLAGRWSDRMDAGRLASLGMGCCAVGLGMFTCLRQDTSLGLILGGQAFLGIGFGLFSSPNTNAVMSSVGGRRLGAASAILSTMRTNGMVMSMAMVGLVFGARMGNGTLSPETREPFLHDTRVAFVMLTALCLAGIAASLARGKMRRKRNGGGL